jgi:hypothetical protein
MPPPQVVARQADINLDAANGEDLEGFLLPLGLSAAGSGLAALYRSVSAQ